MVLGSDKAMDPEVDTGAHTACPSIKMQLMSVWRTVFTSLPVLGVIYEMRAVTVSERNVFPTHPGAKQLKLNVSKLTDVGREAPLNVSPLTSSRKTVSSSPLVIEVHS